MAAGEMEVLLEVGGFDMDGGVEGGVQGTG